MKKVCSICQKVFSGIGVAAVALLLINAVAAPTEVAVPTLSEDDPLMLAASGERDTLPTYQRKAWDLPKKMDFAGESVPLQISDVRERLDRELLINVYWQSNGLLLIKRAHKFFPIIEPILAKYDVPNDFKYLALIESGLQNVVSPSGAAGFWQFMKGTAKEYNLEMENTVDERYHLEKATEAACLYLKKAKEEMGSWTLAAAAYNAGKSGIRTQLNKQQVNDYYDLHLNNETSRYVFRILALKEIMKNPKKYGFIYKKSQLYDLEPVQYVTVDSTITNLANFAKLYKTNYKTIRLLNPWIRDFTLENKTGKTYVIKVPKQ